MSDRLESNARTVSLLTLVSRVTGLLRDALLSRVFGAGVLMSAFFFAFMIPNLFRRLFGEGALAAAFLPRYAKLRDTSPQTARALASMTIALMVIALGAATLIIELVLASISFATGEFSAATVFIMIMLPYMPMVCVVAILGAMLQTHGRFGPTAASPVVLNLCIIAATVLLAPLFAPDVAGLDAVLAAQRELEARFAHLCFVGVSLLVAGVIQIIWSLWVLRGSGWWVKERSGEARSEFRAMLKLAGPMILSLGVLQLNTFFDGIIASYPVTFETNEIFGQRYPLDESAMAVLSFAQRLYQFPLGVFGIAVATAIFPLLASRAHDDAGFADTLRRGLRLVLFIGLPASVGVVLVADPLTAVIYQGGEFSAEQSDRVSAVLLGYAPAIWAYSMTHVLTRAFYARDDSRRPVRIALGIVGLNLALNCVLIWFLREVGLALSTAICATVQVALLLIAFRAHLRGVVDRTVLASWGRTVAVTAIMAAGVWFASTFFGVDDASWGQRIGELLTLTVVGIVLVASAAMALRMPETRWAIGMRS